MALASKAVEFSVVVTLCPSFDGIIQLESSSLRTLLLGRENFLTRLKEHFFHPAGMKSD